MQLACVVSQSVPTNPHQPQLFAVCTQAGGTISLVLPYPPSSVESPPLKSSGGRPTPPKNRAPRGQTPKREQSKLHLQQQVVSCFSSSKLVPLPVPDPAHPAPDQRSGRTSGLHCPRILRCEQAREGGERERAGRGRNRMRPTMKAQHGNGRGSRSPFLTSYALTLAFITFVSVLYFKDFSSTLHRPFLNRPPPHSHPHRRPVLRPRHHVSDSDVASQAGRHAAVAAEQPPFAAGAAPAGCDVAQGEWVYDEAARPWYQEEECPYIQPQLTCQAHGRPDRAYQHWRWQPRGCSLPSFNATLMLEKLRGKRMLFVGDSLNRGQYVSLVCLLHRIIPESSKSMETFDSLTVFKAKDYNATIEFYWAPFLAESNSDDAVVHRIADRIVRGTSIEKHAKFWKGADILVFNTYLWWMTGQKMKILQNSFEDKNKDIIEMETEEAYGMVLNAVLKWVESNMNPKTSRVFFVTMSPTHTTSKDWGDDTDGNCYNQTTPIKDLSYWGPGTSKGLMRVIGEVFSASKTKIPVGVVNITQLSEYRKDAHTQIYKKQWNPLTPEQIANPKSYADCTHWCLPGLQDTWNELLYSKLFFP